MNKAILLCTLTFLCVPGSLAQLKAPNGEGVSAGLVIFAITREGSSRFNQFWIALGGVPKQLGSEKTIFMFPGVSLTGDLVGGSVTIKGSEGSRADYMGLKVRDLAGTIRKLQTAGFPPQSAASSGTLFLLSPNGARIRLREDRSIASAVEADEVLLKVPNVDEAAQLYQRLLGATIIRDGGFRIAQIPGLNIRFAETREALAPTNGRAIARLGFEVKDLRVFSRRLVPGQLTVRVQYMNVDPSFAPLKTLAMVIDPWGVSIDFTEGVREVR